MTTILEELNELIDKINTGLTELDDCSKKKEQLLALI
jgi:hypothetical protein